MEGGDIMVFYLENNIDKLRYFISLTLKRIRNLMVLLICFSFAVDIPSILIKRKLISEDISFETFLWETEYVSIVLDYIHVINI